ncbi:MAG TPA: hypothetical protein PKI93_08795 [Alphaproteobacteria bacterium]|nr:hypothetical protein [Alphaproteobacteria bacterium]HNS44796.1 hypothetical protein [Alphaproteobacteria bacterium]
MKSDFATEASKKYDLFRRIVVDRDPKALDVFYASHRERMVQFAFKYTQDRHLAKETVQEAFVTIYELQSTDANAFCKEFKFFKTWAYDVVISKAIRISKIEARYRHESYDTVSDGSEENEAGFGQDFLPEIEAPYFPRMSNYSADPLDMLLRRSNNLTKMLAANFVLAIAGEDDEKYIALLSAVEHLDFEGEERDWPRLSYKNIADTFELNEAKARKKSFYGRKKLVESLKENGLVPEFI